MPDEKVRVVCQYMGGNFGNKNQNQDADLIAAMLAKQAGAPVKLELSRKEDLLGMHGRWHDGAVLQGRRERATARSTAIQLRGYQRHGPAIARTPAAIGGIELYNCPNASRPSHPVYTNRTVSGNFRGPSDPQGFFGIQSMMDDVAFKLRMDPVEFVAEEHDAAVARRASPSPTTRSTNASAAAPSCSTGRRAGVRCRAPTADPIKRGAGMSFMVFRAGLGRSSAVHPRRRRRRATRSSSASPTSAAAPRRRWG